MTTETTIENAQIYFDTQDPQNEGWAFRYYQDGAEVSGPLDETDAGADLMAIAKAFLAEVEAPSVDVYQHERVKLTLSANGDFRWK